MKRAVLVPFRYILSLVLFALCVCGYVILVNSAHHQVVEGNEARQLMNLIEGLKISLFPGGMLAVLFLLNFILRLEAGRGVAIILLFLTATSSFLFGYYALRRVERNAIENKPAIISSLDEKTILRFRGGGLYISEIQPGSIESVVLYHHGNVSANPFNETDTDYEFVELGADQQKVSFIGTIPYNADSNQLTIPSRSSYTADGKALLIETLENTRERIFFEPALLATLTPVFENLSLTLNVYAETLSLRYILLVFALFVFLFSTLLFLRITRWPLINLIFALFVNFGGLWLSRIHEISVIRDFMLTFLPVQLLEYAPSAVLVFFALLFIIITAFLPKISDWSREMSS